MTCLGIGHNKLRRCNDRPEQYVICLGTYKTENHRCDITRCVAKKGMICIHIVQKYTNYRGNYQAITFTCPAKQKV